MALKSCLAIHHGPGGLVAVLVEKRANAFQRGPLFHVPVSNDPRINPQLTAPAELAKQIAQQHTKTPPVVVSLGGAFCQTQTHHSEFADPRLIRQTLRFDIEEDAPIEAENLAVTFELSSPPEAGADLIVFTADRSYLTTALDRYAQNNLEPLALEPDTASWIHYLHNMESLPADQSLLVAAWADQSLYLLVLDKEHRPVLARSILCPDPENAPDMLATEIRRGQLLWPAGDQPAKLLYHPDNLPSARLAKLAQSLDLAADPLSEPQPRTAFAIGAAIGQLSNTITADFRLDSMPAQSRLAAKKRALTTLAVAASAFLLALALIFHAYAAHYRDFTAQATQQMKDAYARTTGEQPASSINFVRHFRNAARQLEQQDRPAADSENSVSASRSFTLVLNALADLGLDFDLQIDSLRVFTDSATLTGSIPNLEAQFQLDHAVQNTPGLARDSWNFEAPTAGRRPFSMNLRIQSRSTTPTR